MPEGISAGRRREGLTMPSAVERAGWFAGGLKELREAAGLTQPQLAERAGLTKDGIAQLESGRREPAWRTVVALCEALGVGPGEFLKQPAARPPTSRGRPRKAKGG